MSSGIPKLIRDQLQSTLWSQADDLQWLKRSDAERTTWYENWAKDKDIGGVLAHFMDSRKVRVYIKDSLLKPYQRARLESGLDRVLRVLQIGVDELNVKVLFDKPHGRLLKDGRVVCWGNSRDWKAIVLAVFERAYRTQSASPHAAVLFQSGKGIDQGVKDMAQEASRRLQLSKLIWLD
jgi:hypothetical protein